MPRWKAGPERPVSRFCWECSRQLHGRVFSRIIGDDGNAHDVHKACVKGRAVVLASTTASPGLPLVPAGATTSSCTCYPRASAPGDCRLAWDGRCSCRCHAEVEGAMVEKGCDRT